MSPIRYRAHTLVALALAATVAAQAPTSRGDNIWIAPSGSGSWGVSSNWSVGVPNGAGQFTRITNPIPGTITLDGSRTVAIHSSRVNIRACELRQH
jgi:hypothetical protein